MELGQSFSGNTLGGSHGVQDIMSNPFNPEQSCNDSSSLLCICTRKTRMIMTRKNGFPRNKFCGQQCGRNAAQILPILMVGSQSERECVER